MPRIADFGKESGLIHQVTVKGRQLGLGREMWKRLDSEDALLRRAVEFLSSQPVFSINVTQEGTFEEIIRSCHFSHDSIETYGRPGDWTLEDNVPDVIPVSIFFVPGQESEEQVREHMDRWCLQPANTRELLSFGVMVYGLLRDTKTRDQIPVEDGHRTHVVALDARSRDGYRLGINMNPQGNYDRCLGTYKPETNSSFWKWSIDWELVRFLAVPKRS